ncbi:hypothetical protein G6O67_007007 [Ophiocordyceps sinensis]|uniref:Uncharacterized protein n=1 Tax=Ophiocordyceps sinensis TaxID=72228 RepID=A0A8H4LSX9_9HYPO|nr:hypothetical protein G6O67_007007 [Ophiocordyceps sinensis]
MMGHDFVRDTMLNGITSSMAENQRDEPSVARGDSTNPAREADQRGQPAALGQGFICEPSLRHIVRAATILQGVTPQHLRARGPEPRLVDEGHDGPDDAMPVGQASIHAIGQPSCASDQMDLMVGGILGGGKERQGKTGPTLHEAMTVHLVFGCERTGVSHLRSKSLRNEFGDRSRFNLSFGGKGQDG